MNTENHYCSKCRCTQPFEDSGAHLDCPVCSKRLWRRVRPVATVPSRAEVLRIEPVRAKCA